MDLGTLAYTREGSLDWVDRGVRARTIASNGYRLVACLSQSVFSLLLGSKQCTVYNELFTLEEALLSRIQWKKLVWGGELN